MALFDSDAERYDSFNSTPFGDFINNIETELIIQMLKLKRNLNILDLGCGTGNLSVKLAKFGCCVTGIDISEEMLNVARTKAKAEKVIIRFLNMDAHKLDFKKDSFDIVISLRTIEFVDEYEEILKEIFRVTKEKGKILIGTVNKNSKLAQMYMNDYYQKYSIYRYANFKEKNDLILYKKEKLAAYKEYAFVPPDSKPEDISLEKEKEFSHTEPGGYMFMLWQK